jgi:hypothetical protein
MPMRDTAIARGFQMMEISDHEKLKWELSLDDALWGYGGGPRLILRPTEDI